MIMTLPISHDAGTGNGIDGKCSPVEDVPECEGYEADPDDKDANRVEKRRRK